MFETILMIILLLILLVIRSNGLSMILRLRKNIHFVLVMVRIRQLFLHCRYNNVVFFGYYYITYIYKTHEVINTSIILMTPLKSITHNLRKFSMYQRIIRNVIHAIYPITDRMVIYKIEHWCRAAGLELHDYNSPCITMLIQITG